MRLLIVKPSSFGDIVHALLVAERIRFQLPAARIDWVARDVFAGLVEASGLVSRIHRFERSPRGFLRVCRAIRRETYDAVLDMQGLARSGVMTLAARAKIKIGRFDSREGAGFVYRVKIPPPHGISPFHAVDILRQFQRPLGLYDLPPETLDFPDSPVPVEGPGSGAVLLFPESRRAEKEWGGFAELAFGLSLAHPDRTLAWMGNGNRLVGMVKNLPGNVVDFRGKVPLASLPAVVRRASVVVANDSGPMHLAAAMGRAVVALFGPTDPALYGPYPLDRSNHCVLRGAGNDLNRLTVPSVREAVEALL